MPATTTPSIRELLTSATKPSAEDESQSDSTESEGQDTAPEAQPASSEGFTAFEKQLLKDVDTSGWTVAQQKAFVAVRKAYEKGWHGSQAEHAAAKRFVDALKAEGVTNEDVLEVVRAKRSGASPAPMSPMETKRVVRGIDRLLEETTDPAVKEQLRKSKEVIVEEMERFAEERTKPLLERLDRLESSTKVVRESEVSSEVDELEDKLGYPASLVERYRSQLISVKLQQPKWSMRKILRLVATEEEIDEAEAPDASKPKVPGRKAEKPSSVASEVSLTNEDELKPFKASRGGWNMTGLIRHVVGKAQARSV